MKVTKEDYGRLLDFWRSVVEHSKIRYWIHKGRILITQYELKIAEEPKAIG